MARDPRQRPRSAGDLVSRLGAALEPEDTAQVPTERVRVAPAAPPPRRPVAPPPGRSAVPPPRRRAASRPGRRAAVPLAVLALVAVAAAVVVALTSGGSPSRTPAKAAKPAKPATGRSSKSSTAASSPTSPTSSTTAAAAKPQAGSPVSAVESFYHLAAAHRYAEAWALADPAMQSQLGGYQTFQADQAADRSITFTAARTVSRTASSARVAVTTTSVRSNGTQHCAGTVDLVPGGGAGHWQLHQIGINCS
jgi:hypothetical protein